jgi:hypothetical protein
MAPAGEMWSVVTESPSLASTRAPAMSSTGVVSIVMPSKYGGLRTYVDCGSHSKVLPVGIDRAAHCSSPAKTSLYESPNISSPMAEATTSSTSCSDGQMSFRWTGSPFWSIPRASLVMSTFIEPAMAYATTSGGDAR